MKFREPYSKKETRTIMNLLKRKMTPSQIAKSGTIKDRSYDSIVSKSYSIMTKHPLLMNKRGVSRTKPLKGITIAESSTIKEDIKPAPVPPTPAPEPEGIYRIEMGNITISYTKGIDVLMSLGSKKLEIVLSVAKD